MRTSFLFLNVFIIATCGLVYELLAGTLASYILGDSVRQFSLIIGIYLSAMGVGAWVSNFVGRGVARAFIEVEYAVALVGGFSAPILYLSYNWVGHFSLLLYGLVAVIGIMVGLELPLLMRILKDELDFKDLVSRVLAFDYIGALIASLAFPLFLVPYMGLVRTSLLFGAANALVGVWGTWLLKPLLHGNVWILRVRGILVVCLLTLGLLFAELLTTMAEESFYNDPIAYTHTSAYQRIVITQNKMGFQLYLNSRLQFNSLDEYRYHEALVHPALISQSEPRRVVILGGGDGLALREVLKYPSVKHVTLVDLDPAMTRLSEQFPALARLNQFAYDDKRVEVINDDAMIWLGTTNARPYDAAIIDFPDPSNFSLGKLYTTRFYHLLRARLNKDAAVGIQCSSPMFARKSYWCVIKTMEAAGFHVHPYHVPIPSFGVWGFALAKQSSFVSPTNAPPNLRFLDDASMAAMFVFPKDLAPVPVEINRLNNQILVRYHDQEWSRFQ